MKTPKDRSMPLTAAMARFVDVADLVRSRVEVDEVLKDLCDEYRMARDLLARSRKEKPRPVKKITEHAALVEELEDEIMRYLVGTERQTKG